MPRFPEQKLWDRIRKHAGRQVHIQRVENGIAAGMPDTLIIHSSLVTWAEHKIATLPARKTTRLQWKHPLTPDQRNWHRVWTQNGGRSFVVVGIGAALYAVSGEVVDEITDYTENDIAQWRVTMDELIAVYRGFIFR
jgi:hypothetical protein